MKSKKFFQQSFHRGNPDARDVVPHDYPGEHSQIDYLAAATAGEEVAVGYLFVNELQTDECGPGYEVFAVHDIPLVIIPDVGLWVCVAAFEPLSEALDLAAQHRERLATRLGMATSEVPLELAVVAVSPELPRLVGIDPRYVYDAALYDDPSTVLAARRSRNWSAKLVNETILGVLEQGGWGDAKDPASRLTVPRWLAGRIQRTSASSRALTMR